MELGKKIYKKIKNFFGSIFVSVMPAIAAPLALQNLQDAFGTDSSDPLKKFNEGAGFIDVSDPQATFSATIGNIIKIALSFLGVIFLVLMVYGGYMWMTASGNEQRVEKAKNIIWQALIGLIIVLSAYAISYFVVSKLGESALQ